MTMYIAIQATLLFKIQLLPEAQIMLKNLLPCSNELGFIISSERSIANKL